jgi:hypothetical protein
MGLKDTPLYNEAALSTIRERMNDIKARITERNKQIKQLIADNSGSTGETA